MQLKWILLSTSLILLVLLLYYSDFFKILELLHQINTTWITVGFLMFLASFVLRVRRWQHLLKKVNIRLPFWSLSKVYVTGQFLSNLTPGKIGDPARSVILKAANSKSIGFSLPSIFIERVCDVVVTVTIALLGLVYYATSNLSLWLVLTLALYIAFFSAAIYVLISEKRSKIFFSKIFSVFFFFKFLKKFKDTIEKFSKNLHKSFIRYRDVLVLFETLCYSFGIWVIEGLMLFVGFMAIGLYVNPLLSIIVCSTSVLISVATFLPGGLGAGEAVNLLILTNILSISPAEVMTATLISRFFGYWMYAIIGSIILGTSKYSLDVK
jgi:uncharacterized protein (TIRG00374 family)